MSTLKSLLPQAFAVSNIHPRPRKHLSRYTLDCGFKTSESPALRGFVAERAPIRGTSLYLVLKSNGLPRPKIRLFVQNRSRKYRPKVAVATLFQTAFHRIFQLLSQTAHVCFHRRKWVTHSAFEEGSHTAAHTPKQGPSLPWPQQGFVLPAKSSPKGKPEEADARLWRVSASSGVAAPLGCMIQ